MSGKYNYIRKSARYNGKKYEATGKTEAETLKKLAEKLAAAKRGEETVGGNMTVDAWFEEWLNVYKIPSGIAERTINGYRRDYRLHVAPHIGTVKLRDVRDVQLQRILNGHAGESNSQNVKIMSLLKQLFKRARQSRLIMFDPAETLAMPRTVKGRRRSITDEERAAILAVAEYHPAGLLILTLLYTGMRPGEAAALKWGDVDFGKNEIHVHAAMEASTSNVKTPKTPAGIRDIPMRAALREKLYTAKKDPAEFVFLNRSGKPCSYDNVRHKWESFCSELRKYTGGEIAEDLTLYCLRHTFCTDCQRAGIPLNVAKELMGHSDIQITANIYTHKDSGTIHQNFALLDNL